MVQTNNVPIRATMSITSIVAVPVCLFMLLRGINWYIIFGVMFAIYGSAVFLLFAVRKSRLHDVVDKYGLVSGNYYDVSLTNGKEYKNVRFYTVYDWSNQNTIDWATVDGKRKLVKANVGIKFLDGNKEIRVKVVHIRDIKLHSQ